MDESQQPLLPQYYRPPRAKHSFSVWRMVTAPVRWGHHAARTAAPFIGMLFFFIPGVRNRFGLGYVYAWFLMIFFIAAIATSLVLSTGTSPENP
ncbi:hypothetical protein [uncultured Corynebacterium sp.]|uniref:hypothetical protein n=1 Tax=uncultured Corynebacterium sp. TaxID=159447 RepID=UPI0025CC4F82|nr:hypothetical protein [uncultured Corynebacterium sp.]